MCDAALIVSTYNSFSSDHIDWRLATFVSETEWNTIKHDQGASAVIAARLQIAQMVSAGE